MSTYFILYKVNTALPPNPDPKAQAQQLQGFLDSMKGFLKSGILKEIHSYVEGGGGYGISGDVSKEQLNKSLNSWFPFVTFEVYETIPATRVLEIAIENLENRVR
jgi:hypothetical protein